MKRGRMVDVGQGLLLRRGIKHIRFKTLLTLSLVVLVIISILLTGIISYRIGRREILTNAEQSVGSIENQASRNLDDRLSTFEENSYQILRTEIMSRILDYTPEEARFHRTQNEGLPAVITQQSILYRYTKSAFLRTNSGYIYDYYKYRQQRLEEAAITALFERAEAVLTPAHPVKWLRLYDEIWFFRKLVDPNLVEKGLILFSVSEDLFDFVGNEIEYLTNENLVLSDDKGDIIYGKLDERAGFIKNVRTPKKKWTITIFYFEDILLKRLRRILQAMTIFLTLAVAAGGSVAYLLSRGLTEGMREIEKGLVEFEQGHFQYRIRPRRYDEIGLLGLEVNHMAVQIAELIEQVQHKEEEKKKLEIETLQAQINPHFLYNTLGSLKIGRAHV